MGASRQTIEATDVFAFKKGRTPLPTALAPPEDGAKPSRPQRKPRGKAVLPPLPWAAGWARKPPEPGSPAERAFIKPKRLHSAYTAGALARRGV